AGRELKLEFMILFSSLTGALGNVGQGDYAAGNGFLDAYAEYRNGLVKEGKRQGRTLSINWPLWAEGGMKVDAATERGMRQRGGLMAVGAGAGTAAGMEALYRSWALGAGQVLVAAGEIPRLRQKLLSAERSRATAAVQAAQVTLPAPTSVAIDNGELRENAQASLVQAVSELLKV